MYNCVFVFFVFVGLFQYLTEVVCSLEVPVASPLVQARLVQDVCTSATPIMQSYERLIILVTQNAFYQLAHGRDPRPHRKHEHCTPLGEVKHNLLKLIFFLLKVKNHLIS